MIKKTITYTDYNGVERTETFYFNLNKAECAEFEISVDGGVSGMISRIIEAKDNKTIMEIFKKMLLMSYGIKSDDGRRFIKSDGIREGFEQSPAYPILFMELATDDKKAAEFFNQVIDFKVDDK